MKNDILGYFWFRRSLFDSIEELCRTRRKRLYVLQEINQKLLQIKKVIFHEKLGSRSNTWSKMFFFVVKVQFLTKVWKLEINVRAFSTLRIGLSCHMRSTFEERVFQKNRLSDNVAFFDFCWGWFRVFPKRFLQVCKDFGLEPWRKMMRGC